jgi:hypothetical protein
MPGSDEKDAPFGEFTHNLEEVLELLNRANIPVIVTEDGKVDAIVEQLLGKDANQRKPVEPTTAEPDK